MKHTYKRITALALSLALAAGNAGTILPGQFVLKANAAAVTAKQVQGKDYIWYIQKMFTKKRTFFYAQL